MMNQHSIHKHQSGVVLIISLIMLLALTLIGITSSNVTGLEEKMSANTKDINLAFQASEAALRSAEDFVGAADYKNTLKGKFTRTAPVTDTSWTSQQGTDGYYSLLDNTETSTVDATLQVKQPQPPFYSSVDWNPNASTKKYIPYNNSGSKLAKVYYSPEYIIEEINNTGSDDSQNGSLCTGSGCVQTPSTGRVVTFRITAHGWGSNENSVETLQSVVKVTYN